MEAIKEHRTIAKVYRKVGLHDQPTDFAFWQSQPPATRLAALEEIRCEYHGWHHDTQPRLQRVYTIENLKKNKQASGRYQDLADLENLR